MRHFGTSVKRSADQLHLTRENYIERRKNGSLIFSFLPMDENEIEKHTKGCLYNFDLNMRYFESLSRDAFDRWLAGWLSLHNSFFEIDDIRPYKGVQGEYVMVLDEYKQVYCGCTNNIKRRIETHWNKKMPFDRLVFGSYEYSKLSIDSFRRLDTTRIFLNVDHSKRKTDSDEMYEMEKEEFARTDDKYLLNRTGFGLRGYEVSIAPSNRMQGLGHNN